MRTAEIFALCSQGDPMTRYLVIAALHVAKREWTEEDTKRFGSRVHEMLEQWRQK